MRDAGCGPSTPRIPHLASRISTGRRPARDPNGGPARDRGASRRRRADVWRHARQGRAGGPSRRDHRLDPRRDRHARRRHHARRRGRARHPGARRARAAQRRAPRRPPPERRAVAREAHRADPRHAAPGGDSPVPGRAPSRPPHRVGAGTRCVLPGRARQVWGRRGGHRAPAVQSPLRPRLPRRSGEAVVRRGHLRYLRHQDGGHPLLRVAVRWRQGGGRDPSHGTGPLRADPHSVGALRLADSLGLRRAVLLPRDAGRRRRAPAWRAVPLASRFPRMPKRLVYLDNAATTPVRPEVLEAMLPYLGPEAFGNPSSPHRFGRAARAGVEEAKRRIAAALGADPGQVIFTSGGTEADNLAVIGCALAARERGGSFRVAVSAIEHKAVLAAAHAVTRLGGEEIILPVSSAGEVLEDALAQALARGLAVVSVMWVNNEIGVVQPVARLAARCREAGVPFHVDGVQAFGKIPVSLHDVPCTLFTISGHKIGAPKGIGALVVRDRHAVEAILHGGGQQFGIRPGTENVPGIVGLGAAVELAAREQAAFAARAAALRDELERRLLAVVPDAVINAAHGRRAPHVTSVSIPGTDSEALLMHLDLAWIACSSGSACSTGAVEPSHVLTAMGVPRDLGVAALRFSFGKENTLDDIDTVIGALPKIVEKVRALSAVLHR